MDSLRELISDNAPHALALGGLVIGLLFGAVVYRTNYCAMGSLSDIHNFGDYRRFRAWVLAAAVALAGAQFAQAAGLVALDKSMYLAPSINWLGNIAGGIVFGIGMVFAGGCPSRNLARAGGGDLRALITLVLLGLFAYMTIGGLFAPVRAAAEQATAIGLAAPTQSLGHVLGRATGITPATLNALAAALIAAAAIAWCFADRRFRTSPVHVLSGLGVGLLVVAGWILTGLAYDDMATRPLQPVSLTYIRPTGDTLEWLQRYTAGPIPGFGVASVIGALAGALLMALAMRRFRIAGFSDQGDLVRNVAGAAMMGIGGVMALGCTVGQSITGVSTLAAGSFLAFGAIVAGGLLGLRLLERTLA